MKITKRLSSHISKTPHGLALLASRSRDDVNWQFPPAEFTLGDVPDQESVLSTHGVLYTYSIVHVDRERGPYALAMVDFEPDVRVFGPMIYEPGKEPPLGATMEVTAYALKDGSEDYAFRQSKGSAA